ncbi:MAG: helix-turn-helix domain-containing protein [Blastocatellia bacterium]
MKSVNLDLIVRLCSTLECTPGDLIEIVEHVPARKAVKKRGLGAKKPGAGDH